MSELNQQEQERLANLLKEEDANQGSKFSWDDSFQTRLIGMLLTDRYFLVQSLDKIKLIHREFREILRFGVVLTLFTFQSNTVLAVLYSH